MKLYSNRQGFFYLLPNGGRLGYFQSVTEARAALSSRQQRTARLVESDNDTLRDQGGEYAGYAVRVDGQVYRSGLTHDQAARVAAELSLMQQRIDAAEVAYNLGLAPDVFARYARKEQP